MKRISIDLRESLDTSIPISDPADATKMSQLQQRILQFQTQQTTIQKQIEILQKQKDEISARAAMKLQKAQNQNANVNDKQPVTDVNNTSNDNNGIMNNILKPTSEGIKIERRFILEDNSSMLYPEIIYVYFVDEGKKIIGKIYKKDEKSDWETSCIDSNSETFQEMSFIGKLGKYGVLDKLEDFYTDVKELDENEYDSLINECKEDEAFEYLYESIPDEALNLFEYDEDISDVKHEFIFEELKYNKN